MGLSHWDSPLIPPREGKGTRGGRGGGKWIPSSKAKTGVGTEVSLDQHERKAGRHRVAGRHNPSATEHPQPLPWRSENHGADRGAGNWSDLVALARRRGSKGGCQG